MGFASRDILFGIRNLIIVLVKTLRRNPPRMALSNLLRFWVNTRTGCLKTSPVVRAVRSLNCARRRLLSEAMYLWKCFTKSELVLLSPVFNYDAISRSRDPPLLAV